MIDIPSPAVAVVGRHNSGKTTLIERLIAELTGRGLDVGSIKHHSHRGCKARKLAWRRLRIACMPRKMT